MLRVPVTVDVTVSVHLRSRRGVQVHRASLAPEDRAFADGVPVTSVSRTLLDLATLLRPRDLQRAVERAERVQLLDLGAVARLLARSNGHRGVGRLRAGLAAYDPRHRWSRSELERRALELIDEHGLPRPTLNARVGPYEVDLLWRSAGLVVELDGWEFHKTRDAFERDRRRDRWLTARGLRSIRLTHRALTADATETFAEIAAILGGPQRTHA